MSIQKSIAGQVKAPAKSAFILGLIGIILALSLGFLFGIIGAGVALIIGIIAIIQGIRAKKTTEKTKGKGGIVTGMITIVLACAITVVAFLAVNIAHDEADKRGFVLLAEKADSLKFGMVGFIWGLSDDDKLRELKDELDTAVRERSSHAKTS